MIGPADTFTLVPEEYAFDFNRDAGPEVWVRISLPFDVVLTAFSDKPHSPRSWTVDELEINATAITMRGYDVPYESELGRSLARCWDRFVSCEAAVYEAAVYTPEISGSAKIREEAP